ncbi:AEC family transporter [Rummeliibacillus suwonensis]|uniref:AEC family transporter n=1 Tax=Rummeliibacillus suwonensis TaxID=1306154 RepID=UPI001AAF632C|nr:AEC family transporter [Rummeliibacillus suwonensis]MBO2537422.1 AEC family transporter [Rummeliibacillus suwonensis]
MNVLVLAVESVITMLLLIGTGYYLSARKWFNQVNSGLIAKLVTNIALPAYMLHFILTDFSRDKLMHLAPGVVVPIVSIVITMFVSFAFCKLLKVKDGRKGTFSSMFFNSNSVFIGIPLNLALFGAESLPYVLLYYFANTFFFWTLGVQLISKDGVGGNNSSGKTSFSAVAKKVINPPLIGFFLAVILLMLNVKLPDFLMSYFKFTGNLTTPLSMLFIGISIFFTGITSIKFTKDMLGILLGRFVIAPGIMILIVWFLPLPLLMKQVFVMQAAMPVMTNAPVVAKVNHADSEYAAIMVTVSTIASLFIVPIWMLIVQIIH